MDNPTSLNLLVDSAGDACIKICPARTVSSALFCEVKRQNKDGEWTSYRLRIQETYGGNLKVNEDPPQRLPVFCPERHINSDATFCIGWGPSSPPNVRTIEDARMWWQTLKGYLRLQDIASSTRRWPKACSWPHGKAAVFALERERLLQMLPPQLANAVNLGFVPSNRRHPCPCGSGRRIKQCHEKEIKKVIGLSDAIEREENAYWHSVGDRNCCGTMDGCRLAGMRGTR